MVLPQRVVVACGLSAALGTTAHAGGVSGRLELPAPPDRGAMATKGFLERSENPLAPVQAVAVTPWILIALVPDVPPAASSPPAQVNWELVGDSFSPQVLGVTAGATVEIRNRSRTPRTLAAAGQPKLIDGGPLNPTGVRTFHTAAPTVYQVGDADAPHLHGTVVVVATPYLVNPDAAGKFDFGEVAEGSYKLRVFYRDHWIERADDVVAVAAKSKAEIVAKIPAGFPGGAAPAAAPSAPAAPAPVAPAPAPAAGK